METNQQPDSLNSSPSLKMGLDADSFQAQTLTSTPEVEQPLVSQSSRVLDSIMDMLTPLICVFLAAFSVVEIIRGRWLQQEFPELRDIDLSKIPFLARLEYPAYFYIVLMCFICLLAVFAFLWHDPGLRLVPGSGREKIPFHRDPVSPSQQRAARVLILQASVIFIIVVVLVVFFRHAPGGDMLLVLALFLAGRLLQEVDLSGFFAAVQKKAANVSLMGLGEAGLVTLLSQFYSGAEIQWWAVIFCLFVAIYLYRMRRHLPVIYWIVLAAQVILSLQMTAWYYSFWGDEYAFFYSAASIARKSSLGEILGQFFTAGYVYQFEPYLSSLIQAGFLKLLGITHFGWRFGNIFLVSLSIAGFYGFIVRFTPRRMALIAAAMMACSQFFIVFSKIGYDNLQALFAFGGILYLTGWVISSRRPIAFTILGLAWALCFYIYPVAMFVIPVSFLALLMFGVHPQKNNWRSWLHLTVAFLLGIFPAVIQPVFWQGRAIGIFFTNTRPAVMTQADPLFHYLSNFIYTFFSYIYVIQEDHFIFLAYMDMLSAALVMLGLTASFSQAFRQRFAAFWLASFLFLCVGVGATQEYDVPSNTRMFVFVPWFCLFAAFGLEWLLQKASQLDWARKHATGLALACALLITASNVFQVMTLNQTRARENASVEELLLRTVDRSRALTPLDPRTYLFLLPPDGAIHAAYMLQDTFRKPASPNQIVVVAKHLGDLSPADLERIKEPNTLVFLRLDLGVDYQGEFADLLRENAKSSCYLHGAPSANSRVVMWYAAGLESLCD